jgi:Phage integrase family
MLDLVRWSGGPVSDTATAKSAIAVTTVTAPALARASVFPGLFAYPSAAIPAAWAASTSRTASPMKMPSPPGSARDFKAIVKKAGLVPEWMPREMRHSFVSLSSDHGVPLEKIAPVVGHSSTATTDAVYRKQLRPVITEGAETMDEISPAKD